HNFAAKAAEYALAAREQGKFWEMHDKMFGNQQALDEPNLKKYAQEIGVDVNKAAAYIDSGAAKKEIQEDQALAAKVGGNGTPSFFINGIKVSGAQPFANFQQVIDREMTKAKALGVSRDKVYEEIQKKARDSAPPPPAEDRQAPPPST